MTVAFIGPDNYERTALLAIDIWKVLTKLVVDENATIFLFSNANSFDSDCYTVVSQMKERNNEIEMHYYHGVFDYDVGYVSYMSEIYDKVFFPPKGAPFPRYLRDRTMIDNCDVLVTWCNNEKSDAGRQNAAELAIAYAQMKNKRIINLFA